MSKIDLIKQKPSQDMNFNINLISNDSINFL